MESIEIIGIPTANRKDELRRALESFTKNVQSYGRTPEFVIADDSRDEALVMNKAVLEEFRHIYKGKITHLDSEARLELADKTAQQSGVKQSIVRFALCGDRSYPVRTGALRNSILIYGAGKKILFVDDDVICNIHSMPGGEDPEKNLFLTSGPPRRWWYFKSYSEALSFFPEVKKDYIGLHETLLGKSAEDVLSNYRKEGLVISFDKEPGGTSPALRAKIERDATETKIIATYTGAVGDTWIRIHAPTQISSFDREHNLWGSSAAEYDRNISSPFVGRSSPTYALYSGPLSTSLNLGIDAQKLTPPFAPLYRGQDGIFSFLLNTYFPNSISAYIPFLIEHKRLKSHAPERDITKFPCGIGRLTIAAMKTGTKPSYDPQENLKEIGQNLKQLSSLAVEELETMMRSEISRSLLKIPDNLAVLQRHLKGPEYWQNDLEKSASHAVEIGKSGQAPLFWDVEGWDPREQRTWLAFQDWLSKFADVLMYWPDMFCSKLRDIDKKAP
jgi:hypothetical protein